MRFASLLSIGLAALVNAQTPSGYAPSSNVALNVTYGTQSVTANQTLIESITAQRPVISLSGKQNGTYFVALVDLSIRNSQVTTNQTLVQGIASNRTTRLHWLQTNVTQAANGTLVYGGNAIAPYAGPKPPAGDIAHTYVLYLFAQPANSSFTPLTGSNAGRNYTDGSASARYNFNVTALANTAVNHTVVAANYFRVQNTTNSTAGSGAAPSSSASASTSSRASTSSGTAVAPTGATNGTAVSTYKGAAATPFVAAGLFGLAGAGALALL